MYDIFCVRICNLRLFANVFWGYIHLVPLVLAAPCFLGSDTVSTEAYSIHRMCRIHTQG